MQVLLFSENTLKAVKRGNTASFLAKDAIGSFEILNISSFCRPTLLASPTPTYGI